MAVDLNALKTEVTTDPQSIGFAAHVATGSTGVIAALLNDPNNAQGQGSVDIERVNAEVLQSEVVVGEYTVLAAEQQRAWNAIISAASQNGIPVRNAKLRAQILAIWAGGTTTRSNLAALQTKTGSRAEVLFGENITVSHQDVAKALAL